MLEGTSSSANGSMGSSNTSVDTVSGARLARASSTVGLVSRSGIATPLLS